VVVAARRSRTPRGPRRRHPHEGGEAKALTLDLSDPDSIDAFADKADVLGPPTC
jgi:uncharacterized protein YbjT (DUF2867 family)